jgi:glycosyltransferase involved in cell wall biosynthesis
VSYPIRVLHIEIRGGIGGIETFLLNLYTAIDKKKVKFDFISTVNTVTLEKQFLDMGAKIYKIPEPFHIIKYYKTLYKIINENNYSIVHIHKNSAANIIPFIICKKIGVKTIISHSHNTAPTKCKVSKILHRINQRYLIKIKTHSFACSQVAAEWLYGKNYLKNNSVKIIKNGIETSKFKFDDKKREKIRKQLGINENFVIGNVGRFTKQKNHKFLIDIFYELLKVKSNSVLILCGIGDLEYELKEKINKLKINDKVMFLGLRKDINDIMQAMDVFVLPSLYEGLPLVSIEAQCSGLPIIVSDTVSNEIKISDLVTFVSLNSNVDEWVRNIISSYEKSKRLDMCNIVKDAGYDIIKTAKCFEKFYNV